MGWHNPSRPILGASRIVVQRQTSLRRRTRSPGDRWRIIACGGHHDSPHHDVPAKSDLSLGQHVRAPSVNRHPGAATDESGELVVGLLVGESRRLGESDTLELGAHCRTVEQRQAGKEAPTQQGDETGQGTISRAEGRARRIEPPQRGRDQSPTDDDDARAQRRTTVTAHPRSTRPRGQRATSQAFTNAPLLLAVRTSRPKVRQRNATVTSVPTLTAKSAASAYLWRQGRSVAMP